MQQRMRLSTESKDTDVIEMSLIGSNTNYGRRRYSLSDLKSAQHDLHKRDSYRFIFMAALTSTMMIAEVITGVFTGSLTLLSDALHMFSDLIALIVGFSAHRMSNGINKKESTQHTIAIMRYEIVGALINGTILLTSCFIMSLEAIKRVIFHPEVIENVDFVLIVGGLGLFINVVGLVIFGHHGHSHSHSHSHAHRNSDETDGKIVEKHETNLNIHAVFLHILGDLLGSVAVVTSALIIKYTDGWWNLYIDPICTQIIVIFISISACPLIKESANILLDKSPFDININNKIKYELSRINGVLNVHELHCWQVKNGYFIASVHLIIDSNQNKHETNRHKHSYSNSNEHDSHGHGRSHGHIIDKCKVILHKYGIHSSIVQPEFAKEGDDDWKNSTDPCFDYICNENDCVKKSKAISHLQ